MGWGINTHLSSFYCVECGWSIEKGAESMAEISRQPIDPVVDMLLHHSEELCRICGALLTEGRCEICTKRKIEHPDDAINHPSHYTMGGIEVIDAIEAWKLDFRLANVVKYVARCEHKEQKLQDLRKARWYLERVIKELESDS